jgi:hypothetical protein
VRVGSVHGGGSHAAALPGVTLSGGGNARA